VQAPAQAPVAYYAPTHAYAQAAVPVAAPEATVVPVAAPVTTHSQFHAQDEIGGYNYGYATPTSTKQEFRTPDGIVQGSYSYTDANGIVQTVNYVSDAEGFKVAATNLPRAPVAAPAPVPVAVVAPILRQGKSEEEVDYEEPTSELKLSEEEQMQEARQEKQLLVDINGNVRPETIPVTFNTHIFDSIAVNPGIIAPKVVAPTTYEVKHDDMEVLSAEEPKVAQTIVLEPKTVSGTPVPYAPYAHYYAPQQGYVQAPITTPVVQTPVETPVAYYAPYNGYQQVQPVTYQTAPVAVPAPVAAPAPSHSQFHAQDDFGGYNYGYATPESSKQEIRTPDGIVSGTYSYVDANGVLQTVNYVSDAEGFKVAATNLPKAPVAAPAPVPVAEVAPAVVAEAEPTVKAAEEEDDMVVIGGDDQEAVAGVASYSAPVPYAPYTYAYAPYQGYYQAPVAPVVQAPAQAPVAYYAPTHAYAQAAVPVAAPEATVVPVAAPVTTHSQFHAQDEIGGYNYGYATPTSTKQEFRTPDGIVQGSYSYVDANGVPQTVNYVSDAEGFKVAATNLPRAPAAAPAAPVPVAETPAKPVAVVAPTVHAAPVPTVHVAPVVAPTVLPTPEAVVDFNAVPSAWLRTQSIDTEIFDQISVEKAEDEAVETDDMEVIAAKEETPAPVVAPAPYVASPATVPYTPYAYAYAPHQGYYQAPVAPVVQTPVQAPVAYYAPTHAYTQAAVPVAAPEATVVPVTYQTAPAAVPVSVPATQHSQFHAQDDFGGYNYGYATPESTKQEFRTPDGIVQGSYSYVDANGVVQTVNYISDAEGFKVAATNLPRAPLPEAVAPEAAPAVAATAPEVYAAPTPAETEEEDDIEVVAAPAPVPVSNTVPYGVPYAYAYAPQQGYYQPPVTPAVVQAPVHQPTTYYAPGYYQTAPAVAPVVAPVVAPAPVAAPSASQSSQFHAQSEFGEYNYGYSNANSAKQEFRTADGIVQGTYSYVDANGILQTVNYVSDAEGFKVAATNLPRAPAA